MNEMHGKEPDLRRPEVQKLLLKYWATNVRIMLLLLLLWLAVGLGCGILLADWLNTFRLFDTGYPLGFWFAQQGSIIGFVCIILLYCLFMNRLDRKHHRDLEQIGPKKGAGK